MNQTDRLIRFVREHPGATSLEITLGIGCVNVTGRVSDARAEGHVIECRRRTTDGRLGYFIVEPGQRELGLVS